MDQSQSSGSISNYSNQISGQVEPRLCHCNRPTIVMKSWTDDNPGRRFYKCDLHGFVIWADQEKPHGWQKQSLIEARDQIRRLKEEINNLRGPTRLVNNQLRAGSTEESSEAEAESKKKSLEEKKSLEKHSTILENEVKASKGRERLLSQFVLISWGGFIIVTALVVGMLKN